MLGKVSEQCLVPSGIHWNVVRVYGSISGWVTFVYLVMNFLHVLGGKNVGNIMFRVLKCLLIFPDRIPCNIVSLIFYTSNRVQKMTSSIPVSASFHYSCVATRRRLFPMQCFPFAEGKERATVIFYEDFSSLLPVLTMTSMHSSCLSQLPSSLRLFISPE